MTDVFVQREVTQTQRDTQGNCHGKTQGRHWNDAAERQGLPKIPATTRSEKEAWKDSTQSPWGSVALLPLILDL